MWIFMKNTWDAWGAVTGLAANWVISDLSRGGCGWGGLSSHKIYHENLHHSIYVIRNKLDPSNTWSTCMGKSDVLTLKRLELFITLFLHTRPWYSNIYTWKYAFIIECIDLDNMNMPCSINRVCLITILDYAWQYDNPKGTVHSTLSSWLYILTTNYQ